MKIIDAHLHLRGEDLTRQAKLNDVDYSVSGLLNEMKQAKVSYSGMMPSSEERRFFTFEALNFLTKVVSENKEIFGIIIVDHKDVGRRLLNEIENKTKKGIVR